MKLYQAIEEESYTIFMDCEICDKRVWTVIEATSFDEFAEAYLKDNKTRIETYVEHVTPDQQTWFNDGICPSCNKKAKKYEQMILESGNQVLLLGSNSEELFKFISKYFTQAKPDGFTKDGFIDIKTSGEKPKWPPTT